jgi:hypothetical protein
MKSRLVEIGVSLLITLVLGSYAFTWKEIQVEQDEKRQWRDKHEAQLDKRFDEVKASQKELTDAVYKSREDIRQLLLQILEAQTKQQKKENKQ